MATGAAQHTNAEITDGAISLATSRQRPRQIRQDNQGSPRARMHGNTSTSTWGELVYNFIGPVDSTDKR